MVAHQRLRQRVLGERLAEAGEHQRGGVAEPVENPSERGSDVGVEGCALGRIVSGDTVQVVAFVITEAKGAGQCREHLFRGLRATGLLEADVVVRRHPGQGSNLVAA